MTAVLKGCQAPAKLNLFLHVVGQRADGYHLLQSAFQLLDFGDSLDFTVREDGKVRRLNDIPGVPQDSDLVVRAARLLQQASGSKQGADIALTKRLPMGGGLGGGSSDAATTLIALNHMWSAGLSRSELMQLGLQLGADVPFFISGGNAFVEGIGEIITPLHLPERWFVVVEPGVHVPTPTIFRSPQLTRNTELVTIADFSRAPQNFGKNDLQKVVADIFEPVAQALDELSNAALGSSAKMTGSGSCVFCAFDNEGAANQAQQSLQDQGRFKSWKARGIDRHPMAHWLPS